jgi:hypothetical protein
MELGMDPSQQNYVSSFIVNISRHNLLLKRADDTLVYVVSLMENMLPPVT